MGVNSVNNNSLYAFISSAAAMKREPIDFTNSVKPANADKFVLNLPTAETIYKRQEFVNDERTAEGCAYCYTYMERTLSFEDKNGTKVTFSSIDNGGYFAINLDKGARTFGRSGEDMNNIGHAVEETWERRERSLEQSTISIDMLSSITKNGQTAGGSVGFAAQSTAYKYSSVSETKGTVAYKNGGVGNYRETAVSTREIYNKCAVFLAEAFGEKSSGLVLGDREFNELFGNRDGDEKTLSENAAQKRENLNKQLDSLRKFMEKNLAAVRQKAPDCGSLKIFADTYLKLGAYSYSDITSFAEKMFAGANKG